MAGIDIIGKLYSVPGIVAGFTIHEYCHALAAYKLGDDVVKEEGRLTLNPLRHIDLVGFIFILFAGFGWAKPVSFRPDKLKHPRRDKAIIAAAGPLSNLVLGLVCLFALKFSFPLWENSQLTDFALGALNVLLYAGIINIGLFAFNILPLPPLDGSHIFLAGLNLKPETEAKWYKYGTWVLFAIIIAETAFDIDIIPIGRFTDWVWGLILRG